MTSSSHKHGESKKPYQKPVWERQEMFERFVMACCKTTNGCQNTPKNTSGGAPSS